MYFVKLLIAVASVFFSFWLDIAVCQLSTGIYFFVIPFASIFCMCSKSTFIVLSYSVNPCSKTALSWEDPVNSRILSLAAAVLTVEAAKPTVWPPTDSEWPSCAPDLLSDPPTLFKFLLSSELSSFPRLLKTIFITLFNVLDLALEAVL